MDGPTVVIPAAKDVVQGQKILADRYSSCNRIIIRGMSAAPAVFNVSDEQQVIRSASNRSVIDPRDRSDLAPEAPAGSNNMSEALTLPASLSANPSLPL
jgi:hypothetical protein